jgi:hypothetical protein
VEKLSKNIVKEIIPDKSGSNYISEPGDNPHLKENIIKQFKNI